PREAARGRGSAAEKPTCRRERWHGRSIRGRDAFRARRRSVVPTDENWALDSVARIGETALRPQGALTRASSPDGRARRGHSRPSEARAVQWSIEGEAASDRGHGRRSPAPGRPRRRRPTRRPRYLWPERFAEVPSPRPFPDREGAFDPRTLEERNWRAIGGRAGRVPVSVRATESSRRPRPRRAGR